MKNKKITVNNLQEGAGKIELKLRLLAGSKGLDKEINVGDINRPGLSLTGFFDFFAYDRIQIFGLGESAFLSKLTAKKRKELYEQLFSYDILCCIFTHSEVPDDLFLEFSNNRNVPVFVTDYRTTRFISLLTYVLEDVFSSEIVIHGTFVEVYGIGVLILGRSGVGKSECALELIERGHRLVADDVIEVKKNDENSLRGSSSDIIKHHLEIRGLGIINVKDIFGIRSVRDRKRIELVVQLEDWDNEKEYDRLGIAENKYNILSVDVPFIIIPVRPGRNIPIIVETAALNQRLKKMGIFSARELDVKIQNWLLSEGAKKNG